MAYSEAMDKRTLRQLRRKARLSQAALADKLGITGNHLSRLERGIRPIPEPLSRLITLTLGGKR